MQLYIFGFPGPLRKILDINVDGNVVTVYWPKSNFRVEKYILRYGKKNTFERFSNETDNIYLEISGLEHGKVYEFQVLYKLDGKEKKYTEIREVSIGNGEFHQETGSLLTKFSSNEKSFYF